jgi:hypothetical protein
MLVGREEERAEILALLEPAATGSSRHPTRSARRRGATEARAELRATGERVPRRPRDEREALELASRDAARAEIIGRKAAASAASNRRASRVRRYERPH